MSDDKSVQEEDVTAFAKQFQAAADAGGFNPFSLLTGNRQFLGVFLAPFSPSMMEARTEFFDKGTGPLTQLSEQLVSQGLDEAQAREQARTMLMAAQGMLVALLVDDQGMVPVQQLFFGSLEDDFCKHAIELVGDDFPDKDAMRACLVGLQHLSGSGVGWPGLFVSPASGDDAVDFWSDCAERLMISIDDGLFANAGNRLSDLGYWTAAGLHAAAQDGSAELDGDVMYACARCAALGGDPQGASQWLRLLLKEYEPEDEQLVLLLNDLVKCGITHSDIHPVLSVFVECDAELQNILGGCYELELPRFQAHIAAQADLDAVLVAARRLLAADKKSFKQDLNKEAIWEIAVADPGDLLDTNETAEMLDRSTTFVAKRLEQGAIPFYRDGDQVRIPKRSLEIWQKIMQEFDLLD